MRKQVLILAAGGGHTGYAYALAEALYSKVSLFFLVPEGDALSEKRLRRFGKVEFLIKPRGPKTPIHIFALRLAKAFIDSARLNFTEFDVVVSAGSNFCIPPAIIAWAKGIPIVNIESPVRFTKPSRTASLLQPFTTITALQWEEQKRLLKRGVVVGPILPRKQIEPWNGGYILVTGGTHGHKLLFDVLAESDLHNVILQTGRVDPTPYVKKHPEWKVITSTERFHEILAGAKFVVTHFGFTVLETLVYRKPMVLVVNPEWTRTVGAKDAEYLARKMNAVLVTEVKKETILSAVNEAATRKVPVLPNGAQNLAEMIIELLQIK